MRIISKFKDYYDSVQAYGQDEKCVYHRKKEESFISDENLIEVIKSYFKNMTYFPNELNYSKHYIIGFCGKLYPVWELGADISVGIDVKTDFAYTPDDIAHFLGKYKKLSNTLLRFDDIPIKREKYNHWSWRGIKFKRKNIDNSIKEFEMDTKLEKLFFDYKTPIFLISEDSLHRNNSGVGYNIELNPCLKNYKFFKQKDTFTAYQDISAFISGILGLNDPEMVEISDKDMKDKKGFYDYSFKTLPTKKR